MIWDSTYYILQEPFIEKLYTLNRYIEKKLLKYAWSHDLFNKYEPYELRRELVPSCVSRRCWLFVGSNTHDGANHFLIFKIKIGKWEELCVVSHLVKIKYNILF